MARSPLRDLLRVKQAREFKGGLNTFDSDLNLNNRYLTELRNLYPDTNGRLRLRYGTSLFATLDDAAIEIIALEYYSAALVAVCKDGRIYTVSGSGTATLRWSNDIAATRPGTPLGWSNNLTVTNFTQFAGQLILCNGVDKPLVMNELYVANYLADLGTGSNINVPRAKFCATHVGYLILAVTPDDRSTLFIGSKGTAGTFEGDPGIDNDGVNFATNTYVNIGSPDITGLSSFRDNFIVSFGETIFAMTLGEYRDTEHVPRVNDVIENHGSISQRCVIPLGDDILFLDQVGMVSVQRALITATLSPVRESTLIGTDLQKAMSKLSAAKLEQHAFAIHDRIAQQILFFVPKDAEVTVDTDNTAFVYCFDRSQKFRAWTTFDNMPYRCGARTTEGRIFLASGNKIYFYHNQFAPLHNDKAVPNREQKWSSQQFWSDNVGWIEPTVTVGDPISYAFTLPWTDLGSPGVSKMSKYVSVVAEGNGLFTLEMFVDRFKRAEMSMQSTMTDVPVDSDIAVRPANNMDMYAWPHKFNLARFRIHGTSDEYIAFIAIMLKYVPGTLRR